MERRLAIATCAKSWQTPFFASSTSVTVEDTEVAPNSYLNSVLIRWVRSLTASMIGRPGQNDTSAYCRIGTGIRTSGDARVNSTALGSAVDDGLARSHGSASTAGSNSGGLTSTSDSPTTRSSVCELVTWKYVL